MPLTPKRQRFVTEYLVDHNGTQSAMRAGYSPTSAKVTASRLLTDANLQQAVAEGTLAIAQKAQVDADLPQIVVPVAMLVPDARFVA